MNASNPVIQQALSLLRANSADFTRVDLCKRCLGPEGATAFADALRKNTRALSVLMGADEIGPSGATALADALNQNTSLRSVFLGCNEIGKEGAEALSTALEKNPNVKGLWLKRNSIGDEGVSMLVRTIRVNPSLQGLLEFSEITEKGARILADFIRENDSISVLFIGGNHWGPVGSTVIAESLKSNKTLLHLGMDGTETCDEGATAFAAALCENSTLTALNLNSNDSGATALASALRTNSTLSVLRLGYANSTHVLKSSVNAIGPDGATALAEALKVNTALTWLDLRHNRIGEGAVCIAEALRANRTLTHLNLSQNGLVADVLVRVMEVLARNSSLRKLNILGNYINEEVLRAIERLLQTQQSIFEITFRKKVIRKKFPARYQLIQRILKERRRASPIRPESPWWLTDIRSSTRNTKTQEDLPESLLKQIESYNARVSGLQTTNGSVLDIQAPFSGSGNFSAEDVVSDAEESAQIAKLEGKALRNSCYAMLKRSTGEVFLVD